MPQREYVYLREIGDEETIPLSQIPDLPIVGRGSRNRRVAPSTIYRWASPGCRGVQLEVVRVGGVLKTTESAVHRFTSRLSGGTPQTSRSVRRRRGQADAELDKARI